jgi:hypothetical protein
MSNMRKSSRFWWLHGAILLSAAIGCNRNCTNAGGSGAPAMGGPPPYAGPVSSSSGPIGSAGASLYSQGSMPSYSSGSPMSSGSSPFTGPSGAGYPAPNMSSAMPQGLGSTR